MQIFAPFAYHVRNIFDCESCII